VLSICIPTFNRADLLRSALWALVPQVQQAGDLVEVLVSDNCSPDHTEEIVKWAQQYIGIRYYRNNTNLGATANILGLANRLARGQFCWFLGDDDLANGDAVQSILEAIQSHPGIDYVFLNHSYESLSEREKFGRQVTATDFQLRHLLCRETQSQLVQHWEDIILFSDSPALFTSLVSHVFRLSKWKQVVLAPNTLEDFCSLESTFPHTCIIARMMVGKPSLYLGNPHVILFTGTQTWFDSWPMLLFVRVLELADLFESLGARRHLTDRYRVLVFRGSSEILWALVTRPTELSKKYFSLKRLVLRYWRYDSFRRMFAFMLRAHFLHWKKTSS
jgi:glycosyltransferase involved in cell wall biosynthesis